MKIIQLSSGLGNTMFQYAAYIQLCKMYPIEDIYVDTIFYRFTDYPLDIEKVFKNTHIKDKDFFEYYKNNYDIAIADKLDCLKFWKGHSKDYIAFSHEYEEVCVEVKMDELPLLYKEEFPNLKICSRPGISFEELGDYFEGGESALPRERKRIRNVKRILSNHPALCRYISTLSNPDRRYRFLSQIFHFRKPDYCGFPGIKRLMQDGENVYYNIYGNPNDCQGIRKQLLQVFSFPELDETNRNIFNEIWSCESVAVHTRIINFNYGMGELLKRDYLRKGIKYIKERADKKVVFYLFSDNINWCKKNLELFGFDERDTIKYVTGNNGSNSYKDMQLMSACKYFLLPNSTFSWWAAYLSQRKNKMIITPFGTLPGTISF